MNISQRLVASAVFSAVGLIAIAAVSYFAVTSIQSDLLGLTTRATPLQNKTYETQERTERLLSSLLRLSLVKTAEEAQGIAELARQEIESIKTVQSDVRRLDPASVSEVGEFEAATQSIVQAVETRLTDELAYRKETDAASAALAQAEQAISITRQNVNGIEKEAIRATDAAQDASRRLAESMKQILSAESHLKQIAVLVSEVGATTPASRLSTNRAEIHAAMAAIQQIGGAADLPSALREVQSAAASILDMLLREGSGLVPLREAVLGGKPGAEAAYARQRTAIIDALNQQSQRLANASEELELQALQQQQALVAALKVRNEPGGVISVSQTVSLDILETVAVLRLLMLADTPDEAKKTYQMLELLTGRLAGNMSQMRAGMGRMGKTTLTQQVDSASQAMESVKASGKKVFASKLSLLKSQAETADALGALKSLAQRRAEAGTLQVKTIAERQSDIVRAVDDRVDSSLLFIAVASTAIVLASSLLAVRTIVTVRSRLTQAVQVAETVSRGDLRAVEVPAGSDETTRLLVALRSMVFTLTETVRHIDASAQSIDSGTEEIANGNHDLSVRTEIQAAKLQATASAVQQLTSSVRHNAGTAKSATSLAEASSVVAVSGGSLVAEVVTTMDQIHGASQQISEIIAVIENIAFRINLLALNAAVEAAQAGSHGHGFAVVANEVRDLAHQSSAAAKEIKSLITSTVEKIAVGHKRVEVAGATMLEIVGNARQVADHVSSIALATGEQAEAIEQVRKAVHQLEEMTQQNAALAEETSAATTSLRSQAQELNQAIAVFSVERS